MPDNTVLNSGTGGDIIATDELAGGVKVQRVKVGFGGDGVLTDVDSGTPLPVTVATLPGQYAEDAAHSSGAVGQFVLGVQQTSDTALAGEGDYAPLQVDEVGRLKVSNYPASQSATTGNITANAQTVAVNVSRTSNVVIGMVATTLVGHNATFEASVNSTNGTDGNWYVVQVVRSNANTIETTTGTLAATPAYLWEASVNGYTWFRIRATAHTSGTAAYTIQPAPFASEPIPAAQISGTQPVSGTVTANIGTGSIAAGTNAIGDVGVQYRANATGAASRYHLVSAATTNAANVKASAGRLLGVCLSNTNAAWRYVKLHNTAGAPTAGTGVVQTIGIPPNGRAQWNLPGGIAFSTGIAVTTVTGAADADATAVGANDIVGDLFFA